MLTARKDDSLMSTKQIKAEIKQLKKQLNSEYRIAHYRLLCLAVITLATLFVAAVFYGWIQL
jgi:hypoxanthine-guanine phosphoribosyltransferase